MELLCYHVDWQAPSPSMIVVFHVYRNIPRLTALQQASGTEASTFLSVRAFKLNMKLRKSPLHNCTSLDLCTKMQWDRISRSFNLDNSCENPHECFHQSLSTHQMSGNLQASQFQRPAELCKFLYSRKFNQQFLSGLKKLFKITIGRHSKIGACFDMYCILQKY